ncbi:MAG: nuclear transport factor 2 family protein [Pseudobdellovibrionaceae bacterium]|nr:nuclear transport factor 2 family protein [Pseudobdellovibrionaceae bacterium]
MKSNDLVKTYFQALERGDFASLSEIFHHDIVWHQPGHSDLSAVYKGIDAVFKLFAAFMERSQGTFKIDQVEAIMTNGPLVSAIVSFSARRGLESIAMKGVDLMRIIDGKIVEVHLFSADSQSEDAFWSINN